MKIAFITPGFVPVPDVKGGAIERLMTYLIEQNEKTKKFEIDLYTIDHSKLGDICYKNTNMFKIKLNKLENVCDRLFNHFFWRFNIKKSFNQYGRKSLKKLLKKEYDYILIENNMYIYQSVYSKVSKIYPNTKFLFHLHNDIGKVDKPNSLCKYILSTAETVITCSEYLKKRLLDVMNTDNIKVLYNVVNFEKLLFNNKERTSIRKKYNMEGNFVYGYIGRISKEKGVLELVKAFKKIYKNNKNAKLMIIGDTLFNNKKNRYCKDIEKEINDIRDAVILTGSVDNNKINNYMSAVDALVIPTICEEAFGIVAAEGIACERPILATKSGGMVEVINEKSALLIEKNKIVDDLANGLITIMNKNAEYEKKAKYGRQQIIKKKQFHYDKYLENFNKLLK